METAYSRQSPPNGSKELHSWIDDYIRKNEAEVGARMETEVQAEIAIAHALLPAYFDYYKKDFVTKRFQRVEKTWRVHFGDYVLTCKIDGEFLSNRKPWLMEHKTKGRIDDEKLQLKLSFDFQNLYYATIYSIETGKESVGTLYNVLRNPKSKPKVGESLPEFTERLQKEIRKNPTHYFKRWEVAYTQADHKRFRNELPYKLQIAENILTGKVFPYRNEFACEMYFGCEYLGACASGSMNGYYQKAKLFEELGDE